ncbi:MAG: alpha/beta hydrolase [Treponema sp.]|nr:alpha/beta hydrolase [Treponema sp.]
MKKKTKRVISIAFGSVVVLLFCVVFAGGMYLNNFAIKCRTAVAADVVPEKITTSEADAQIAENGERLWNETQEWLSSVESSVKQIESSDGLQLKAVFFPNGTSDLYLIAVHGYSASRQSMHDVARVYHQRGYNVLAPDNRAHGESEGKWVGMGWLDRKDILLWIDRIVSENPAAKIVLHGISMGGAAVMMTSGENLPVNVKGVVEDCGYTSVWDIFADEMDALFHLPSFPLLNVASGIGKLQAGYFYGEASSLEAVKKATVPILFIHGSEDNFVHTEMVHKVYDACPTQKQKLVVEGAGHGQSYQMEPELYFSTVFDFLSSACGI